MMIEVRVIVRRVLRVYRRYLGRDCISPNLHSYILFRILNLWYHLQILLSCFTSIQHNLFET
ncbi:MAG: hypothetical protein ACXACH_04770 [Candidatus Hermodarchaeia archaeon]